MSQRIEKYTGMVIQPAVTVAEDRAGIEQNLERVCNMIDFGVGYFWEIPVRLIVLPEYFLQGVTTPGKGEHGIESFMKKAITIPGPEMDVLGAKAKEYGLYIAGGGVIEQVPEFPDRWFPKFPLCEALTVFHRALAIYCVVTFRVVQQSGSPDGLTVYERQAWALCGSCLGFFGK